MRPPPGFVRGLGAVWAGGSEQLLPERLDAAIMMKARN
jgi:hypothetical protein